MAKVTHNLLLYGVRGRIGDVVVRQTKHGTVLAKRPKKTEREPSAAQEAQQEKFRLAGEYAKTAAARPEYQAAAAKHGVSAYTYDTLARILGPRLVDTKRREGELIQTLLEPVRDITTTAQAVAAEAASAEPRDDEDEES